MTAQEFLNLKQIAKAVLGDAKKESTIRSWVKNYSIPSELTDKERLFESSLLPIFEQIKALKAERPRLSEGAIRANVSQALGERPTQSRANAPPRNPAQRDLALLSSLMTEHTQAVMGGITETIRAEAQTAEKYAQAMRDLGRLEALLRMTQEQLSEAQKQILQLPETAAALDQARAEAEALRTELEQEKAAHTRAIAAQRLAQEQLEAERQKRPWWRIWSK